MILRTCTFIEEETSYEAAEEESDPGGVKHLSKTKAWSKQTRCWNYSLDGKNDSFFRLHHATEFSLRSLSLKCTILLRFYQSFNQWFP